MKKILPVLVCIMIICGAVSVFAADIAALDKISILMPKSKVVSILGTPQETVTLAKGLKVDVYPVHAALPLIHSGCIYDKDDLLVGQSFVFHGHSSGKIAERLKKHGFTLLQNQKGLLRLSGVDDDTKQPLVAVIEEHDNLTTITTFEKIFYESHVK
ncbi:MAG: hypothetical protein QMD11_01440 [Smithella sp.]|nr:hypothetical protein [Smithella sp.]